MDINCVVFLFVSFVFAEIQANVIQDECNRVFYCCEKIDTECTQFCGPIIECAERERISGTEILGNRQSETTEAPVETTTPSEPESTTLGIKEQKVIGVNLCRKGFRMDGTGKCRKSI